MIGDERLITKGRKFDQVLEGARRVFMREGYKGASVDDIAREAAVSKATLYSYFPDKQLMFQEVFRGEIERVRGGASALGDLDLPIDQVLRFIGHVIANNIVSDVGSRTLRLAIAEAERFPGLAAEYYAIGPGALLSALERRFLHWQEEGMLRDEIGDMNLIADSFVNLNTVRVRDRVMLTGRASVNDDMIRQTVDNAVGIFLRAFGTPRAIALLDR
ncbi:TetR/AcrR family transcriptional regulator [Paracoccus aerodenitrificans]|uniref:TetR/AcrR family transcriptional regulator n=1 Tax=Paracoccus aerodenitrificans TaxID=3017781 RepID=UPI0022F04D41|nr:TetR/AcrR family transcriptional regulator [Paracoccus aerodenitrificans]WBU64548.1 TetR/AcrR family transcriptional regulator [Paracoccus aerodenitrificans]